MIPFIRWNYLPQTQSTFLPYFQELLHGHAFLEIVKDKIFVRV
ncbi:MAG: hypothetical protein ABI763_10660 [Bacteroidota bacterium]